MKSEKIIKKEIRRFEDLSAKEKDVVERTKFDFIVKSLKWVLN